MIGRVNVHLWGEFVGAVAADPNAQGFYVFEYDGSYFATHPNPAPLMMPTAGPHVFRNLRPETFRGLPGMLADSLPDKFGNAMIDAWLARQGRTPESFSPIERLCYIGTRGMGALEFEPDLNDSDPESESMQIDVERMVELASTILRQRAGVRSSLSFDTDEETIRQMISIGTSPGGARAKALIAWNAETGEVRSGQVAPGPGFEQWLIKFDGVSENRDRDLADPQGYSLIEYAYYLMAKDAGIEMSECRLLGESGRHHFMTRRFDRTSDHGKIHMQSLGALRHFDLNDASAPHAYEEAMLVSRQLGLGDNTVTQQYRRMVFNVAARNQDDHVKNTSYLMSPDGEWSLSPAYDLTFAFNTEGWTRQHQMRIHGQSNDITRSDLVHAGVDSSLRRPVCESICDEIIAVVERWPEYASIAGVDEQSAAALGAHLRVHDLAVKRDHSIDL